MPKVPAVRGVRRVRFAARALPLVAVLAAGLLSAAPARAQDPVELPAPGDELVRIELVDGTSIVGRIREVAAETVVVETVGGARITVERSQIRAVTPADGAVVQGRYWSRDRSDTRLYFSSTARSLRQGEGYVGTYVIFLPFVAVGVTDRVTVAAGAPILFGEFEPVYFAPKVQVVRADRAQLSVGTLAFLWDGELGGIAYGVGTFGTLDTALHLGVGYGYSGDEFSDEPVAMIGAEARVSPRVKFLTENYVLPDDVGNVFSFGLRIIGERLSTDIGVAGISGDETGTGCCLPMVNFSYAFGGGGG